MANEREQPKPEAPKGKPSADEVLAVLKEVHAASLVRGARDDPTTVKLSELLERIEPTPTPKPER